MNLREDLDAEVLEPLRFPLYGSRLIEASAGTGKTFTIAMLYVRLVLGHGALNPASDEADVGDEARTAGRALTPPEILVVTFTDAATKELRERIRARLIEAAECFRVEPEDVPDLAPGEDLLHDLREDYAPEQWPGCARRLQLAAEWMDEAAVSTIHGWCNRMLSEHAFDSDSLFSQTLETDQTELRAEVVRDYWRTFMAPLDARCAAEVRAWFASPDALHQAIRGLLAHADLLPETPEPETALLDARKRAQDELETLKAPWRVWIDQVEALLNDARAAKQFDARKLNSKHAETWIGKLRDWANDPESAHPGFDDKAAVWTRLTPAGLAEIWTKGEPPAHAAFVAMETLRESLAAPPEAKQDLLCHAARWIARRFEEEEARRSQMGFDDLLTRLRAALQRENGARLAEIIRKQYPVALIDEFQDTDPVQYAIFDAVYRIAAHDTETAIVLIGDPKQAIYAFRGADIYTYLEARRACEGRLYTLKKNFRSTRAMVDAVNRCFEAAELRPEGSGAFLFRSPDGRESALPFIAADAHGRPEKLVAAGAALPALNVWWMPPVADGKPLSKGAYLAGMAASCASEMVRLLNLGQEGAAGFMPLEGEGGMRPLQPAHMAVLVNNRSEAQAIREALAARGVRSVYLSDRDSVYQTPQAEELRYWLAACAEPDDGRLVRTALATSTLGLDWAELDLLGRDEFAWEKRVLQFREYRDCWRKKGVLPMLRRLFNDFHVPQRLLGEAASAGLNGERALTNLLHLAELLQQASTQLDGEHALIRYLDEQREDESAGGGGDARQLRLESDAGLVQVVTIHKSKGLEYPLVFLPFACAHRAVKPDDVPFKWHDEEGALRVTLEADASVLRQADRERLGEDLRKLYVALTRARYATWIGYGPVQGVEASAFGYLLNGGGAVPAEETEAFLGALRGPCEDIAVAPAPQAAREVLALRDTGAVRGQARTLARRERERWWVASYSSLKTVEASIGSGVPVEADEARSAPDTRGEDVFLELLESTMPPDEDEAFDRGAEPLAPALAPMHGFERGADAGSFLHELMEWAADEGFAAIAEDEARVRDMVARRCSVRGWSHWIDLLTAWMLELVRTPLRLPDIDGEPVAPVAFAALGSYMAELEFWVTAHTVDTLALDALVTAFTLDGEARPALDATTLNGMLKGFIDLVFEHEGRYYVADYKSNWLGPDDASYTAAKMRAQILHSRYELQYVLYLFALHRLLKARLPDYDYDRHVGGAVYLFLRGGRAPGQGLHCERPPRELIERLDALFARRDVLEDVA